MQYSEVGLFESDQVVRADFLNVSIHQWIQILNRPAGCGGTLKGGAQI
jgi:hypothetical protein